MGLSSQWRAEWSVRRGWKYSGQKAEGTASGNWISIQSPALSSHWATNKFLNESDWFLQCPGFREAAHGGESGRRVGLEDPAASLLVCSLGGLQKNICDSVGKETLKWRCICLTARLLEMLWRSLVSLGGCVLPLQSCPILRAYGLRPSGILCSWDSLGWNTSEGCHALFQGIFLTQGSGPQFLCFLHWQADSLPLVPPRKPLL